MVLAVFSPGTGLLEIGALFLLLGAGYGVYNLPVNWWAFSVLVVGFVPFILAVRKSGRMLYLVISLLALVIGSAFLFQGEGGGPAVNPLLAAVVSAITVGYLWIGVRKALEAEKLRPAHSLEGLAPWARPKPTSTMRARCRFPPSCGAPAANN
jgi:membrane-bound serine protease (ClpP class)